MAFDTTAKIVITGEATGLEAAMNRAHQVVSQRSRDIEGVIRSATGALAALGVGLSAGAIGVFARNAISSAAALDDMSEATGASVSGLSKLNDIARIGGGNLQTVGTAVLALNKALLNPSADENKGVGAAFKALNLNTEELLRLAPDKRLEAVAIAFNKFADGAGKGNAAQVIFKKNVEEVMPFLNDLYENLDRTGSLTAQQAKDAEDLGKAWNRLAVEASNLGRSIVVDLAPGMTRLIKEFVEGKKVAGGFFEAMRLFGLQQSPGKPGDQIADIQSQIVKIEASPFRRAREDQLSDLRKRLAFAKYREKLDLDELADELGTGATARPQLNFTAPPGGGSQRKAQLTDLQKFEQRIFKERMEMLDAESEEAQRLWLEKFDRERTLAEYKKAQHLEEMAQQRELDEYYRTGGEEAAREYREADDKKRAEDTYHATVKAAEDAKREWERTSQGITDSLTDALLRGFEGGADAAKNFVQTLKNLFATLVLRPIIQPIAQQGANLALGAMGMGAAGSASAADILGIGQAISGITGGAGIGGAVATGLEALGASTGVATGWGAAVGTVAPYLAIAALAYSMLKPKRGGPKSRGDSVGSWQTDYAALVKQLGGTPGAFTPYLQYESDPRGTASSSIYASVGGAGVNYQVIGRDVGRDEAALQAGLAEEYTRMLIAALKATDLPAAARDVFAAIDPATASAQDLADALSRATAKQQEYAQALNTWGNTARDIAAFRVGLAGSDASPLDPFQKLREAGGTFWTDVQAAKGGDQQAAGAAKSSAAAYLSAARGYYASGSQYAATYEDVQWQLSQIQNSALARADMGALVDETRTGNRANEAGLTALLNQLLSIDARLASIESTNALAAAA